MELTTVIAAYDEVETITPLTRRLHDVLTSISDYSWEMIFVVEGRDGTREALEGLSAEVPSLRILYQERPSGLGSAFRRGFAAVSASDVVVTLDADLNHQPEEIPRLLEAQRRTGAAVVVGSRFVEGSRVDGSPMWKRALSGGANLTMRVLYGLRVKDKTSGFRVYRASVLRECQHSSNAFAFLPELLIRINSAGYRIVEEPIHFIFRREGRSKLAFWPTTWSYLRLFAVRFLGSRRRSSQRSGSSREASGVSDTRRVGG